MLKRLLLILVLLPLVQYHSLQAQEESLDSLLEKEAGDRTFDVSATFKSTRVISGHSIERMPAGEMDFRVSHRFDRLNKGFYEFFGMDESSSFFSLEMGLTDWVMVGIGRGTVKKFYNTFAKFSLLRQSEGSGAMPLSLSLMTACGMFTTRLKESDPRDKFSARLSYTYQLLLARKFSENLSLQLAPTLIHRNIVGEVNNNDLFALGIAGRYKLTSWVAVCFEYYPLLTENKETGATFYSPLAIGFDIETGSHVFQIHFTNSISMVEQGFIGETTGDWSKGDIRLGFNISRVFTIY